MRVSDVNSTTETRIGHVSPVSISEDQGDD